MAVTINPEIQVDQYSWKVTFSSSLGDPTFYVYLNGKLYETTKNESIVITISIGSSNENIIIEVFDSVDDKPARFFPGCLTLNWKGSTAVDYYIIKKCVDSEWTEQVRIYDHGEGWFSWTSAYLDDVTEHLYQIIPVGDNGNEGSEVQLTCLMVRHPDIPSKSFSYSDVSHKVTIS